MTLVDEIKLYLKIFDDKIIEFEKISPLPLGALIELTNVKQAYTNDLNFVYQANFYPDSFKIFEHDRIDTNMSFKQRLRQLNTKMLMPTTNLATIDPLNMTRSCLKIIVDLDIVMLLDLSLRCVGCRNKANYCECEVPDNVMGCFAILMCNQAGHQVCLMIRDFDVLATFMDLTPAEYDYVKSHLRKVGEFKIVNDMHTGYQTKSHEKKKIFSYFNRLIARKAVYGILLAKKDKGFNKNEGAMADVKGADENPYSFANGMCKAGSEDNMQILTPYFTVQFAERVPAETNVSSILKNIFNLI